MLQLCIYVYCKKLLFYLCIYLLLYKRCKRVSLPGELSVIALYMVKNKSHPLTTLTDRQRYSNVERISN